VKLRFFKGTEGHEFFGYPVGLGTGDAAPQDITAGIEQRDGKIRLEKPGLRARPSITMGLAISWFGRGEMTRIKSDFASSLRLFSPLPTVPGVHHQIDNRANYAGCE